MSDADKLRNRARRMLELAQRARGEGHPDYAKILTQIAAEVIEQAGDMDCRPIPGATAVPPAVPAEQATQQQQQQPQPQPQPNPERSDPEKDG